MGAINVKHTGSGAAIALSSDGTSLLLDGTAIGGGGGATDINGLSDGYSVGGSVGLGSNALANDDGTSNMNTAVGVDALTTTTSGTQNTAVGSGALQNLTTGTFNSTVGRLSLYDVTTGSLNVAMGYIAGLNITTGSHNTFIGYAAQGTSNISNSVGLGYGARTGGSDAISVGTAYSSGASSLAAAITNNTSSYGATGANSVAIGQLAKSTASQSFSMGNTSFASGAYSMALGGFFARSEGENSLALGSYSLAENVGSVAIGPYSQAKTIGKVAFNASSTGSMTIGPGKQQRGLYILKTTTADATQTVLTGNGSTPDASNSWIIGIAAAQAFSGTLIARQDRDDGHDYAAWEIKGAALRNATVVELGTAIVNKLYNSTGASAWAIAVSANTTLGTIEIKVTGAASTDIDWVATIDTSELVNI
jgi:hypothetical protein